VLLVSLQRSLHVLMFISITSLYVERETGIEPATSSLGNRL
jgi:hypothetical protein